MTTPLPPDALDVDQVATKLERPVAWVTARIGMGGWPTTQRSSDRALFVRRDDLAAWRELSEASDPTTSDPRGDPDE